MMLPDGLGPPHHHGGSGWGVEPVRRLRHRMEVPMLVACSLVTTGGVLVAAAQFVRGVVVAEWAVAAVVGLCMPAVAALVLIRWMYWRQVTSSVEVTSRQLGQLHDAFVTLVGMMGLDHTPRLYVSNGQGAVIAWASKCRVRRGYVVLASDLVDVAYELGDWSTVRFVLAHELAHIRCGHVALWRTAITALPALIRLDRSLSRAQEYTADRCAARYVPEGARGLMVLYAGKRLYRHVDVDVYLDSVGDHSDGIWVSLVNLLATHPVGFRRMQTLAATAERGWDVHGRLF